ncbi:MAG: hypothetical protein ABL895_05820 [Cyclobacteriaceae bacterium]
MADSKIDLKLYLLFIPVAYVSYLFHEFGHWIVGELLGNDMAYSLNFVWTKSGQYIDASHDLYVSIGGPVFTILQSIIFLLLLAKHKIIYLYPFLFFPMFMRFFSLVFGGFSIQDEARISVILNIGAYTFALGVLLILFMVVFRASRILRIDLKTNGYFVTMSTLSQLLVIGTYKTFS